MRVQRIADAVKEQLRHARSKEEANQIVSTAVSGLSKNDPDKEYIVAAVNRVWTEFHKSGAYSKLPNTVEEAKKKTGTDHENKFADEDKEDDFDLKTGVRCRRYMIRCPRFRQAHNRSITKRSRFRKRRSYKENNSCRKENHDR